jgi:pimeloyl-[acyl-carrier protein] methyl ester esterase
MSTVARRPRLVLLHGWGLNGAVFETLARQLEAGFEVRCLDLPGHGQSGADVAVLEHGIDALAAKLAADLAAEASGPLQLLGWSLGGMAALAMAARDPQSIARLTLVATTPCFVARDDWTHGLAPAVLEDFATQLRADYRRTVHEFLELQVRGSAQAAGTLQQLQQSLDAQGSATPRALAAGLELLRSVDLRPRLAHVNMPTLVIGGQYDRVTPPGAGRALAAALPQAEYREIARAGHAPFLSHAETVAAWLLERAHV